MPLLRSPVLLDRMAKVGNTCASESILPTRINEFVTFVVARHVSNQFEWAIHHPSLKPPERLETRSWPPGGAPGHG